MFPRHIFLRLTPRPTTQGACGFSLIEVTLAMGVLSVCLLTIIGLLPVGLNTASNAMNQTVSAQIVQRITSEAALTKFANLDSYVSKSPFFFDQEGQDADSKTVQRFKVTLNKIPVSSTLVFPGSSNAPSLTNSLYAIQAVISDARVSTTQDASTYVIYIPNSGG